MGMGHDWNNVEARQRTCSSDGCAPHETLGVWASVIL